MGAELGGGGAGQGAKNSCIPHRFLRVSSLSCSIHIAKISCQGRAVELPGYVCVCVNLNFSCFWEVPLMDFIYRWICSDGSTEQLGGGGGFF